jgi:hypothetical protein
MTPLEIGEKGHRFGHHAKYPRCRGPKKAMLVIASRFPTAYRKLVGPIVG